MTTRIVALTDALGDLVRFVLLPGQRFETVEFLGTPTAVATGAVTLARATGAALIPLFCFRDGGTPRLILEGSLDPALDGGRAAAAAYVRRLDALVRAYPEQWRGRFQPG